jgi:hypothetical protein
VDNSLSACGDGPAVCYCAGPNPSGPSIPAFGPLQKQPLHLHSQKCWAQAQILNLRRTCNSHDVAALQRDFEKLQRCEQRIHLRKRRDTMANPKGRGGQSTHPGLTIKGVLMGDIPLVTGERVAAAAITDIHNVYREIIHQENQLRPKAKRLHGMTYQSFYTLFRLARYLGLVEFVRDEPMLYPPSHADLYTMRKNSETEVPTVAVSTRRVFRLTERGRNAEESWRNLHRAWRQYRERSESPSPSALTEEV